MTSRRTERWRTWQYKTTLRLRVTVNETRYDNDDAFYRDDNAVIQNIIQTSTSNRGIWVTNLTHAHQNYHIYSQNTYLTHTLGVLNSKSLRSFCAKKVTQRILVGCEAFSSAEKNCETLEFWGISRGPPKLQALRSFCEVFHPLRTLRKPQYCTPLTYLLHT